MNTTDVYVYRILLLVHMDNKKKKKKEKKKKCLRIFKERDGGHEITTQFIEIASPLNSQAKEH